MLEFAYVIFRSGQVFAMNNRMLIYLPGISHIIRMNHPRVNEFFILISSPEIHLIDRQNRSMRRHQRQLSLHSHVIVMLRFKCQLTTVLCHKQWIRFRVSSFIA